MWVKSVSAVILLFCCQMSSANIDCFECVDFNALPDVNLHVACESPDAVFKKTYCDSQLRGCVEEVLTNTTDQTQLTYRYCIQRGSGGYFESPTGHLISSKEPGNNATSCIRENRIDVIRDVCTCTEDLCNYDGCSTCEEYCNVQADDPVPDTSVEMDPKAKEGGITCIKCLDPNSGESRCGLPGVQEMEDYCGDDATRACVEINVSPIGSKYRRCFETAVKDFPEYFVGLTDVSTYSSNISFRGCNVLELNGGGSVTTCICDEDRCNSPCTFCESCEEDETTTTTTSSSQPTTSTTAGSGVANASPLAVSAIFLALQLY